MWEKRGGQGRVSSGESRVRGEATVPTAAGEGGSLGDEELMLEEIWRCQRQTHLGAVMGENMIQ